MVDGKGYQQSVGRTKAPHQHWIRKLRQIAIDRDREPTPRDRAMFTVLQSHRVDIKAIASTLADVLEGLDRIGFDEAADGLKGDQGEIGAQGDKGDQGPPGECECECGPCEFMWMGGGGFGGIGD